MHVEALQTLCPDPSAAAGAKRSKSSTAFRVLLRLLDGAETDRDREITLKRPQSGPSQADTVRQCLTAAGLTQTWLTNTGKEQAMLHLSKLFQQVRPAVINNDSVPQLATTD